jgi:hypothetical protein
VEQGRASGIGAGIGLGQTSPIILLSFSLQPYFEKFPLTINGILLYRHGVV